MKLKYKALLFNFIGFATLFIIFRLALGYIVPISSILLAVTSAIIASVLTPKFGLVQTDNGKKIWMKWIFIKGTREI